MPSSFTFTFDDECLIAYDTPQSKGMIDGDTIIVEWLNTGDANRLAHLAIDEAKRQLIDTANQYKSVLDAIIEALYIQGCIKHKSSLYSDKLCRAERFLAKVKANELAWL